jgi:DNA-binding FadR family transcriptional regulator
MSDVARRERLTDTVTDDLLSRVASGGWPVGSRIPAELELAAEMEVSRGTVREAVRALTRTGVLEIRRGRGTFVGGRSEVAVALRRRLGNAELIEAFELRRGIETEIAKLAALRRTEPELAGIEAALSARTEAESNGVDDGFVSADVRLHSLIAQASHNSLLIELYDGLASFVAESVAGVLHDAQMAHGPTHWHEKLVAAIAQGDPVAAGAAAAGHLGETLTLLAESR